MTNLKGQIEIEINEAITNMETQTTNDKRETLRNIIDKYVHLSTAEHLLDDHDLREIISGAKTLFANKSMPTCMGDSIRKTAPADEANVCVIEATISALNKRDCLKKLPKFDYRDDKFPGE